MKCVVTGAAGFIGSHLCEHLLRVGHQVRGLDAFIAYYPQTLKERNLADVCANPAFSLHRLDLRSDSLDAVLADVDVIFHLAAMPGLKQSWTDFDAYATCNIQATYGCSKRFAAPRLQRLISPRPRRFMDASPPATSRCRPNPFRPTA
jgi:nucleoside-diphosphate-sugar epimerase